MFLWRGRTSRVAWTELHGIGGILDPRLAHATDKVLPHEDIKLMRLAVAGIVVCPATMRAERNLRPDDAPPREHVLKCPFLIPSPADGAFEYHPEKNDEKGISHVLINTKKGLKLYERLLSYVDNWEIDYKEVEPNSVHAPLTRSCRANRYRIPFYKKVEKGCSVTETAQYYLQKEVKRQQRRKIVRKLFIAKIIHRLYNYFKLS